MLASLPTGMTLAKCMSLSLRFIVGDGRKPSTTSWDDASIHSFMTIQGKGSVKAPLNTYQPLRSNKMEKIKSFLKDESGMETLEYAVIAGLIAAVAIVVYASGWGTALSTRLNGSTTNSL